MGDRDLAEALDGRGGSEDRRNFAHPAIVERTAIERLDHQMAGLELAIDEIEAARLDTRRLEQQAGVAVALASDRDPQLRVTFAGGATGGKQQATRYRAQQIASGDHLSTANSIPRRHGNGVTLKQDDRGIPQHFPACRMCQTRPSFFPLQRPSHIRRHPEICEAFYLSTK
ncbi:hypothetical protein ACFSUK_05595 [Sphingobium scionense]